MSRTTRSPLLACCAAFLLLSACAPLPPKVPEPPKIELVGWFKELKGCREEYAAMDARVAAAGVGDAQYYRVPGFPYLRTDRLNASYRNEVSGIDQVGGWIRRMREMDQEAREFEYMNLGMDTQQQAIQRFRFLSCSRGLAGLEFDDPVVFEQMKALVVPPDNYSPKPRPVAPGSRMATRIREHQDAVKAAYAQPLPPIAAPNRSVLWKVQPVEDLALMDKGFQEAFPDELGFPGLVDSQWRALAEIHAPQLWVETAGDADRLGAPMWTANGLGVETAAPQVFYQISFARFGPTPVVQVEYFAWFPGPVSGPPLDGMIWRVTIDLQARPLVYESLHASGRDHLWFPVQPLERKPDDGKFRENALIPQDSAPARQPTLRLAAGTHAVLRVVEPDQAVADETRPYLLQRYENLFMLPLPAGGTRSLFGPDGWVLGTEKSAGVPWWDAGGIPSPNALRQYGHHPIALMERREFDDPFLLDSVFTPPPAADPPAPPV